MTKMTTTTTTTTPTTTTTTTSPPLAATKTTTKTVGLRGPMDICENLDESYQIGHECTVT